MDGDGSSRIYRLQYFNPNQPTEHQSEDTKKIVFVKAIDGYAICTCMERFATGIPCMHEFHIGLRRYINLLFSERWFKEYPEKYDADPEAAFKVQKILEQEVNEQKFAYNGLLVKANLEDFEISENDIQISKPQNLNVTAKNFNMGKTFFIDAGKRTYISEKRQTDGIKFEDINDVHQYTDAQIFGSSSAMHHFNSIARPMSKSKRLRAEKI